MEIDKLLERTFIIAEIGKNFIQTEDSKSVEEYLESERIYLTLKEVHPLLTDIRFFFKAIYNILTRKIVSG